jgi:hypothetical protein
MPSRSAALTRYAVQPDRAAKAFGRLPLVAREILRLCDGQRSVAAIRRESPLEREMTDRVLERLAHLGLIRAISAERAALVGSLFRPAEWRMPPIVDASPEAAPPPAAFESRPVPALPTFSADEEAFFSRGIDHLLGDDHLN